MTPIQALFFLQLQKVYLDDFDKSTLVSIVRKCSAADHLPSLSDWKRVAGDSGLRFTNYRQALLRSTLVSIVRKCSAADHLPPLSIGNELRHTTASG